MPCGIDYKRISKTIGNLFVVKPARAVLSLFAITQISIRGVAAKKNAALGVPRLK